MSSSNMNGGDAMPPAQAGSSSNGPLADPVAETNVNIDVDILDRCGRLNPEQLAYLQMHAGDMCKEDLEEWFDEQLPVQSSDSATASAEQRISQAGGEQGDENWMGYDGTGIFLLDASAGHDGVIDPALLNASAHISGPSTTSTGVGQQFPGFNDPANPAMIGTPANTSNSMVAGVGAGQAHTGFVGNGYNGGSSAFLEGGLNPNEALQPTHNQVYGGIGTSGSFMGPAQSYGLYPAPTPPQSTPPVDQIAAEDPAYVLQHGIRLPRFSQAPSQHLPSGNIVQQSQPHPAVQQQVPAPLNPAHGQQQRQRSLSRPQRQQSHRPNRPSQAQRPLAAQTTSAPSTNQSQSAPSQVPATQVPSTSQSARQTDQQMADIQQGYNASLPGTHGQGLGGFLVVERNKEDQILQGLANSIDTTMPKTNQRQREIHEALYLAWRDCREAEQFKEGKQLDQQPVAYQKLTRSFTPESDENIKRDCWKMLFKLIEYQLEDEAKVDQASQARVEPKNVLYETFGKRLEEALPAMKSHKEICKNMMDPTHLDKFCHNPGLLAKRTKSNRSGNAAKGVLIQEGKLALKRKTQSSSDPPSDEREEQDNAGETTPSSKRRKIGDQGASSSPPPNRPSPLRPQRQRAASPRNARQAPSAQSTHSHRLHPATAPSSGETSSYPGYPPPRPRQQASSTLPGSNQATSFASATPSLAGPSGLTAPTSQAAKQPRSLSELSESDNLPPIPGPDGITTAPSGYQVQFFRDNVKFTFEDGFISTVSRDGIEAWYLAKQAPLEATKIANMDAFIRFGIVHNADTSKMHFSPAVADMNDKIVQIKNPDNWNDELARLYGKWLNEYDP